MGGNVLLGVAGLGEVVVTLAGGGTSLTIADLTPGVSLCTDDVRVGNPVAGAGRWATTMTSGVSVIPATIW